MNTKTKTNLAWGHINGGITGRGDTNTRPRLLIIFCYSAAEGQGDRVPNAVWYSRVMMDTTAPWSNRAVHRNEGKENWLRADKEAKPELIQTLLKRKVDKHSSSLPGSQGKVTVITTITLDMAHPFSNICQPTYLQEYYISREAHVLLPHRHHHHHTQQHKNTPTHSE